MSIETSAQGNAPALLPSSPCVLFRRADGNTAIDSSASRIALPYPNIEYDLRAYSPNGTQGRRLISKESIRTMGYGDYGYPNRWAALILRLPYDEAVPVKVYRTYNFSLTRTGPDGWTGGGSETLQYSESRSLRWSPGKKAWVWDGTGIGTNHQIVPGVPTGADNGWDWIAHGNRSWVDGVLSETIWFETLSGTGPSFDPPGPFPDDFDDVENYAGHAATIAQQNNRLPDDPRWSSGWSSLSLIDQAKALSEYASNVISITGASVSEYGKSSSYRDSDGSGSAQWDYSDPVTLESLAAEVEGYAAEDMDWADVPPSTADSNGPLLPWGDRMRALTGGLAIRPGLPVTDDDTPPSLLLANDGRDAFRLLLIRYRHTIAVPRTLTGRVTHTHAIKRLSPKEDALPMYLVKPPSGNPYPLQGEDEPMWEFTVETVTRQITRYSREIPRPWTEYGWINYEIPGSAVVFPHATAEHIDAAALTVFGNTAGRKCRLRAVARDGRSNWRV
ncbi:MAG: hypothetical protein LBK99_25315, partial [Opitutaceae bacterium]|nr:hypothetical protein [Opitutaceae bacterium]